MKAVAAPGRVALALLGGWRLTIDGRPATAPAYEKGRALLAYLAIENRWLSREMLGGLFWPDSIGHRANLRQVLANLRAILQDNDAVDPCLLVQRDAISIGTECADLLDVTSFLTSPPRCDEAGTAPRCAPCLRQMEQAESLYRGDFLAGFTLADCPEFEEWMRRKREALRRHAVALCGRLADCHARHGAAASALAYAHRAAELDPWDEAARRRLMQLMAIGGQNAAAMRQYEALEASLASEIGTAPEEATQALYRRLRAGNRAPAEDNPVAPNEVRRVVVLQAEPDLSDDAESLDAEQFLAPQAALFDATLSRWQGQRFPTTGLALGAVFGLVDDGEQAPRRALQAALEIAARPEFSRTRIGICEGKVLVGPQPCHSVAGGTLPALAQRLALCAEPGEIVAVESLAGEPGLAASIERLSRRRFRGLGGEHTPCRIKPTMTAAPAPYPLVFTTPFVGRAAESAGLAAALSAAGDAGRTLFVELTGLPGTGKSRLLAELARSHEAAGGEVRWIAHRPELRHASLGALFESRRPLANTHIDLTRLSGRGLIDALIAWLFSPSATSQPALLVFDDLHWADEATRELLLTAMRAPPAAPVLAVLAGRPSAGIEVPADVAFSRIVLQPFPAAESLALIAAIDGNGCLDGARRLQLARISGGLPLYAEYLTRAARDQPVSDASLFGLLQSVLDRLGADKPVLQAAAVLGAGFRGDWLRTLLPECDVDTALVHAEALAISRRGGDDAHAFRHALLRDCAYESIPFPLRREWHRRAAAWLRRQPDAAPADIAQHYEAAHAWREAREAWRQAAQAAYQGEFAGDAEEAAMRALGAAEKDGAPLAADDRAELELLAGLATLMAEGFGAKAARRLFAPTIARPAGELPVETVFRAICGMAAASPQGCQETLALVRRGEAMARTPIHRMMVGYGLGGQLFWRGEFVESLRFYDEAIAIGETLRDREWLRYSADHPVVACRALKCINLAFSGSGVEAEAAAAQAVADARREGRAHGLCFALTAAAAVHQILDHVEEVERLAGEGLELAERWHFQLWRAYHTMFDLWAQARRGRLRLRESFRLISMHREFAAAAPLSPVTAWRLAGNVLEALESWTLLEATASRGLAIAENGGDRYCMPDLMRQKALARHGRGDARGARRCLEEARALAETLGSHGLTPLIDRAGDRIAPRQPQSPPQ